MTSIAELTGASEYDGIWLADRSVVQLVDHNLSDARVVAAARVSHNRDSGGAGGDLSSGDRGLIAYLMRERHGSPFEHGSATFMVACPIFVAREWMRHRAGHSYNEVSGRYTELEPVFHVPAPGNMRRRVGKPGAYTHEPLPSRNAYFARTAMIEAYRVAWREYRNLLESGSVAPEQARMVLPVGIYTRFYWTANPRSLMHWLSLRHAPQAQQEIRECADQVAAVMRTLMPATWEAFNTCGEVAP